MTDKGKKPNNSEEEDNMKVVMIDDDKLYQKPMLSSLLPPSTSRASSCYQTIEKNFNYNMSLPGGENMFSNGSSESSSQSSKGGFSIRGEIEDAEEDEVFSNLLGLGNHVSRTSTDPFSKNSTENHDSRAENNNDLESMINPLEIAVQTSDVARSAARSKPIRALRKAMPPDVLARLSIQDPKKARRIITNRMSAVRAKEKKKLYTYMLEHQIHTLQTEATTSNAHLALFQTETISLNSENARLKEETSMVLLQIRFQDSLNDEIRKEIHNLRMLTQMGVNRHQQGMMLNNVNHNYTGNTSEYNDNPATGQFLLANNQNYQYHHVANDPYHQEDQIQTGFEQINIGKQYPWQIHKVQCSRHLSIPQEGEINHQFNQELPVEDIQDPNHEEIDPSSCQQQDDERNY